jgi:hypothetical protein
VVTGKPIRAGLDSSATDEIENGDWRTLVIPDVDCRAATEVPVVGPSKEADRVLEDTLTDLVVVEVKG